MKQLIAVAWKEWREVRWVVVTALVTFVALPIVAGIEGRRYAHGFVFAASPWVMFLGGILATVVGATTVTRDVDGRIADFWQSRPFATWRWLAIKYAVGLVVMMVCCLVPVLIERWREVADPEAVGFAAMVMVWFPFIGTAQYSFGFLCGSIMRRGGRAIMLALALSLLAYFLPILLPPLRWMNVSEMVMNGSAAKQLVRTADPGSFLRVAWQLPILPREQMPLAIAAIVLSAGSLLLAIIAVTRGWRVRAAQKLTYWSIGVTILLAFGSAAFHLGSNLPVLHDSDLGSDDLTIGIHADSRHGDLLYIEGYERGRFREWGLRAIEIDGNAVRLGPKIALSRFTFNPEAAAWLPNHPNDAFLVDWIPLSGGRQGAALELLVVNLQSPGEITTLKLATARDMNSIGRPSVESIGNRLYVSWWSDKDTALAAQIDVSNPAQPQVRGNQPFFGNYFWGEESSPKRLINLLPDESVPIQERLTASVGGGTAAMAGNVLVARQSDSLSTFRMTRVFTRPLPALSSDGNAIHNTLAEFQRIGRYQPAILDKLIGNAPQALAARDHLVFLSQRSRSFGLSLARVVLFDLSDPESPRPIGHFAAPGEDQLSLCPLPDGRLLAGGHKLYLVGAPPHHGS